MKFSHWIVCTCIWLSCFFSCFTFTNCLLPSKCVANATEGGSRVCCPSSPLFSNDQPCGYPYRGECRSLLPPPRTHHQGRVNRIYFKKNLRKSWPYHLVRHLCHCYGHYDGADCAECKPGWTGHNCNKRLKIKKRRNVLTYSEQEKKLFRKIVFEMYQRQSDYSILMESENRWVNNATMQQVLIYIHHFTGLDINCYATRPSNENDGFNHESASFVLWHRYFMLKWERLAQKLAWEMFRLKNFTFPYWDWTDQVTCNVCTDDLIGAAELNSTTTTTNNNNNGQLLSRFSPFHNVTVFCAFSGNNSCTGCFEGPQNVPLTRSCLNNFYPTSQDISQAFKLKSYLAKLPNSYSSREKKSFFSILNDSDIIQEWKCNSFAFVLEGGCKFNSTIPPEYHELHNRIHNICEGTFFTTLTSPNDPLFILHHVQVDRIFESWLRLKNEISIDELPKNELFVGFCRDCPLVGFIPIVSYRQVFVHSWKLGYDYDSFLFNNYKPKFQ